MYLLSLALTCFVFRAVHGSKLIFFLVDGFRWDYFDLPGLELKGFPRMFKEGVKAEYMIPDFPTNSFPNYKTLETGLHVENHGFVGNFMYDDVSKKSFDLFLKGSDSFDIEWWNKAEPFYISAEKQGITTTLYYIRGCQLSHGDTAVTYCIPYADLPTKSEIKWAFDDTLEKFANGKADISYIYHETVDKNGHLYGPNSDEVFEAVQEVDQQVDYLLNQIVAKQLDDEVDVILVSDHGMTSLDTLHLINITSVLDMDDVEKITEGGTQMYLWPKSGKGQKLYDNLKTFSPHLNVYLKDELQDRWFFKGHRLTPPIVLHVHPGWFIVHPETDSTFLDGFVRRWRGNHGFDNSEEDMRSIYVAWGPDFKKGFQIKAFPNVNVYQTICHVTGIKPRPHNGTWPEVKDMFLKKSSVHDDL